MEDTCYVPILIQLLYLLSDVRALRDIIRKNFTMYYSQENLISLNARQLGENHLIDETEIFGKVRLKIIYVTTG